MNLSEQLPEFYRYCRSELRPARVAVGVAVVILLCGSIFFAMVQAAPLGPYSKLSDLFLFMQAALLGFFGSSFTMNAVSGERAMGTWDFQRMTPQGSWRLTLGKFLGAPIFAAALWLAFIPWIVFVSLQLDRSSALGNLELFMALTAGVFLLHTVALLGSTLSDRNTALGGNKGAVFLLIGGITLAPLLISMLTRSSPIGRGTTPYFGWEIAKIHVAALTSLVFGLWALLGARWRIGADMLEAPRAWRLPLFMLFLFFYTSGFPAVAGAADVGGELLLPYLLATVVAVVAAVVSSEGLDEWKRWLGLWHGAERIHRAPLWCIGWLTTFAIGVAVWCLRPHADVSRLFLVIPGFLLRDFAMLQVCRLSSSRSPTAFGLLMVGLAYVVPAVILGALFKDGTWNHLVFPAYQPVSLAENLAPAWVEAGIAVTALGWRLKMLLTMKPIRD